MDNLPPIVKKRVDFFRDSCYNYLSLCKIRKKIYFTGKEHPLGVEEWEGYEKTKRKYGLFHTDD